MATTAIFENLKSCQCDHAVSCSLEKKKDRDR